MEVKKHECVIIRNPLVVEVLSAHADNDVLLKAVEDTLVSFVDAAKEFMRNHAKQEKNKRERSSIIEFLQNFDKKQRAFLSNQHEQLLGYASETLDTLTSLEQDVGKATADAKQAIVAQVAQVGGAIEKGFMQTHANQKTIAMAIDSQVSQIDIMMQKKMGELNVCFADKVSVIASTLSVALEKMNVDNMSKVLGDALQSAMSASTSSMMQQLMQNLKDNVCSTFVEPLVAANQVLEQQLAAIPPMIASSDQSVAQLASAYQQSAQVMACKVKEVEKTMVECMARVVEHVVAKHNEAKELGGVQQSNMQVQMMQIPALTKSVLSEMMRDIEQQVHTANLTIGSLQKQCDAMHAEMRRAQVDAEVSAKAGKSTNVKGQESEDKMVEMLSEKLLYRDGYVVEKVSGQAQSCDIVVRREKYPNIRIECKAHADKVRVKEVDKFVRDLTQCNNHGIFVSFKSGICGINNFELQQLSTGKFAVYLSNNQYDVDAVIEMLHLLYRLDEIMRHARGADGGDGAVFKLSPESVMRIKTYLRDAMGKIASVKQHMKESCALLSEIQLDLVEKVILGQAGESNNHSVTRASTQRPAATPNEYKCEKCDRTFKSSAGHREHVKKCSAKHEK